MTNDIKLVGNTIVTIKVSMQSYSEIPFLVSSFTLTIVDDCETAVINNLGQEVDKISYFLQSA